MYRLRNQMFLILEFKFTSYFEFRISKFLQLFSIISEYVLKSKHFYILTGI